MYMILLSTISIVFGTHINKSTEDDICTYRSDDVLLLNGSDNSVRIAFIMYETNIFQLYLDGTVNRVLFGLKRKIKAEALDDILLTEVSNSVKKHYLLISHIYKNPMYFEPFDVNNEFKYLYDSKIKECYHGFLARSKDISEKLKLTISIFRMLMHQKFITDLIDNNLKSIDTINFLLSVLNSAKGHIFNHFFELIILKNTDELEINNDNTMIANVKNVFTNKNLEKEILNVSRRILTDKDLNDMEFGIIDYRQIVLAVNIMRNSAELCLFYGVYKYIAIDENEFRYYKQDTEYLTSTVIEFLVILVE